jgi:hypothetical protein
LFDIDEYNDWRKKINPKHPQKLKISEFFFEREGVGRKKEERKQKDTLFLSFHRKDHYHGPKLHQQKARNEIIVTGGKHRSLLVSPVKRGAAGEAFAVVSVEGDEFRVEDSSLGNLGVFGSELGLPLGVDD